MEEKIIEMPVSTLVDAANFILAMADGSLKFVGLTEEDRAAVEHGVGQVNRGLAIALSGDPDPVNQQEAARLLMLGGFRVGERCAVSASEAKNWEIKKRGGPKRPGKRSKKMRVINDYLRLCLPEIMRANPAFSPKEIAEEIILDGNRPTSMSKDVEYLTKVVRKEINALKAEGKGKSLRLVHG